MLLSEAMLSPEPCLSGWPILLPEAMILSGPRLLLLAMSGLWSIKIQTGSGLVSLTSAAIHGCMDAWGLQSPEIMLVSEDLVTRAILIWVTYADTRAMVWFGPKLLQTTMPVSMFLL